MAKGQCWGSSAPQCAGATCVTAIKHGTKINFTASLQAGKRRSHLSRKKRHNWHTRCVFIKSWAGSERSFEEPVTLVVSPKPAVVLSLLPAFWSPLLCLKWLANNSLMNLLNVVRFTVVAESVSECRLLIQDLKLLSVAPPHYVIHHDCILSLPC